MIGGAILLLVRNLSTQPPAVPLVRSCSGILVHAPCTIDMRIKGTYRSILPDNQVEVFDWDDGLRKTHYLDGTFAGLCDTILSANTLSLEEDDFVDWDLHDLSEDGNDIGHGPGEDNLGLSQCNSRIYSLLIKNWSDIEDSLGNLIIGSADVDQWNGFLGPDSTITLPPDSVFALICENSEGISVGAGNCNLRMAADGGDVVYGMNYNGCSV